MPFLVGLFFCLYQQAFFVAFPSRPYFCHSRQALFCLFPVGLICCLSQQALFYHSQQVLFSIFPVGLILSFPSRPYFCLSQQALFLCPIFPPPCGFSDSFHCQKGGEEIIEKLTKNSWGGGKNTRFARALEPIPESPLSLGIYRDTPMRNALLSL